MAIDRFPTNKNIFYKPLIWGMGHTTRSIPLMQEAIEKGNKLYVHCTTDQKEIIQYYIPEKIEYIMDDYPEPTYGKYSWQTKWKVFRSGMREVQKKRKEAENIDTIVREKEVDCIISDAALAYYHRSCHNILVNHQMNPYTGMGRWTDVMASQFAIKQMKYFDEIWVPDVAKSPLAGDLSQIPDLLLSRSHYIGWLSPLKSMDLAKEREYLIILSGPQPYRDNMQRWAENFMKDKDGVIIGGKPSENKSIGMVLGDDLSGLLASSQKIICSSGYSTLMDLQKFNPDEIYLNSTPGQPEQEYLRRYHRGRKNYQDINELNDY